MDNKSIEADSVNYFSEVTVTCGKPASAIKDRKTQTGVRIATILGATMLFLNSCAPVKSVLDAPKEELTKVNVENTEDISTSTPNHTPTPTELPTATPTLAPTETKEPEEESNCKQKTKVNAEDLSLEIEGVDNIFTVEEIDEGVFYLRIPSDWTQPEFLYPKTFTLKMPGDGWIYANQSLRIKVNGEQWELSEYNALNKDGSVIIPKDSSIEVVSPGIPYMNRVITFYFEKGENLLGEKETIDIAGETYSIQCDEENGHRYIDVESKTKDLLLKVEYPSVLANTNDIFSVTLDGYTVASNPVGTFLVQGKECEITFKTKENGKFRLYFLN